MWQYCKDIPALSDNSENVVFAVNNLANSFSFKAKITGQTGNNGTKELEIMVLLKYLSNFWRTLENPLIKCKINLNLTWSANCVNVSTDVANQGATFAITVTKIYVPVVTLSTQDNAKLLQQLKSSFTRTINWNECNSKPELLRQNGNLNYLVEPSFEGINRLFVLSFENDAQKRSNKRHYLPNVEIKDYNVMIDWKNFFDQPVKKKDKITFENIRKSHAGPRDDYAIGCSLDYHYFKKIYKMIAIDLSKQQALDADPSAIQ